MSDLEQIVKEDLERNGFSSPPIVSDGKIHRFKRHSSDTKEDAWYVSFVNKDAGIDFLAGAYGDWRDSQTYTFCTHISLSSEKKAKIFKKIDKQFEGEQTEKWEQTAKETAKFWDSFTLTEGLHAYLVRKKITNLHGARLSKDTKTLLVPVQDLDNKIWGIQRIDEDGKKLFNTGAKKKGNFFRFGTIVPTETVYLCEGFATGCSIFEATQKPVLVCFDAGNLVEVSRLVREHFSDIVLIVCGDNDVFTENNPGKTKAEEAAKVGLGSVVLPVFKSLETKPTDFNDLYVLEGLDKIRELILGAEGKRFYVKCLGFQGGSFFYTTSDNLQISALGSHSESELLRLMPLAYWEAKYANEKKMIQWSKARSDLMESCRSRGVFTKELIRGNGVWVDQDKIIVHLGDRLFYDKQIHSLHSLDSNYIYELDKSLGDISEDPLSVDELSEFRNIFSSFSYSNLQQAMFLGGWMALAPICGALHWRPHLWLTGEPGSGKTTIKKFVDEYLMHSFTRLSVIGATTEAGIRQVLKASAIPLVFDEFEPEGKKGVNRVEDCLDLTRQASSDQMGEIIKGSADGNSVSYCARFMALFSSVKPRLIAEADKSRFTYIELVKGDPSNEQWEYVQKKMSVLTPDFGRRLFARALSNIHNTLRNIETFQKAFVAVGASQRIGQQYGALLGGWHSLESDEKISLSDAVSLVRNISLEAEESISDMRDQEGCLDYLLASFIRYKGVEHFSVSSMITEHPQDLEQYRMKMIEGDLFIAINNPQVDRIFTDSKWGRSWAQILKRLDGCGARKTARIQNKVVRGILIPRKYFNDVVTVVSSKTALSLL